MSKTFIEVTEDSHRVDVTGYVDNRPIYRLSKENDGWSVSLATTPGDTIERALAINLVSLACHKWAYLFDQGVIEDGDSLTGLAVFWNRTNRINFSVAPDKQV